MTPEQIKIVELWDGYRPCKIYQTPAGFYYDHPEYGLGYRLEASVGHMAVGYVSNKYPDTLMGQPLMYRVQDEGWFCAADRKAVESGEVELVRADWVVFEANNG